MKLKLLLLSTFFVLHLASTNAAVVGNQNGEVEGVEDLPDDDKRKNDHQKFFQKLTGLEKEWVLRLAIKQERDELASRRPNVILPILQPGPRQRAHHGTNLGGIGIKPIDSLDLVPPGLLDYLLNGQISPKFQKDLIGWLREEYGFDDSGFLGFSANSNEYCQGKQCWDLGDIGGECCPFG